MLTDDTTQNLTASDKIVKKSDGGGLHIGAVPYDASAGGSPYRFEGKQKTVSGGEYPEISIYVPGLARRDARPDRSSTDPAERMREIKHERKAERSRSRC